MSDALALFLFCVRHMWRLYFAWFRRCYRPRYVRRGWLSADGNFRTLESSRRPRYLHMATTLPKLRYRNKVSVVYGAAK